jgi:transposase
MMNSDETGFSQHNGDGTNLGNRKAWLWGLVTPLVSFFEIVLSRSQETAKSLIGKEFQGIVTSDRYGAYNWLPLEQRQICWAHLKRDFIAMSERSGIAAEIGNALLNRQRRLFRWWHRVRDGTMSYELFVEAVSLLRRGFQQELESAATLDVAPKEKTPLAKTVRTCRQILKVEPALWTFVNHPRLEPTNNAAEQALRPAVIWRRLSFGSQSRGGSEFVARMLTVTTSLRAQNRSVLDFLTQACRATRLGLQPPSLLPDP